MTIHMSSPAFTNQGAIPAKFTCSGSDLAPALAWTDVPREARSLALIMDDPDAPGGTYSHWVAFDLPPTTTSLPEGGALPAGAQSGKNDYRKTGYGGPCPPPGKPHHYHFTLYALDKTLGLKPGASRADVLAAIKGHVIAQGQLVGTFER